MMKYINRNRGFRVVVYGVPTGASDVRIGLEGQCGRVLASGDNLLRDGDGYVVSVSGGVFGSGRLLVDVRYMLSDDGGVREVVWRKELSVYLTDGVSSVLSVDVTMPTDRLCSCCHVNPSCVWWQADVVESGHRPPLDIDWVE